MSVRPSLHRRRRHFPGGIARPTAATGSLPHTTRDNQGPINPTRRMTMPSKSDARTPRRGGATARTRTERTLRAERESLASRIRDGYSATRPPESHDQPSESAVDDLAVDMEF